MAAKLRHAAVGVFGLALVAVVGVMSSFAGAITCHEDVQSSAQAPHLCSKAATGIPLWLPGPLSAAVLLALLAARSRTRTVACATAALVAAEIGVIVLWALVSHGTITY
jgi:hypothetical protein